MIEYRIDKKPVSTVNARIKDMSGVLKEIGVTYKILVEVIDEHEASIGSPSINAFRSELRQSLINAITAAETISDYSEKLVVVSEQASKHLAAFEEHFSAALQKHTQKATV